jgi:hypothetical protein
MKALGLNTDGMEFETDWKPPTEVGTLHNTSAILNKSEILKYALGHISLE